ncbi:MULTISPECIES: hypothetical protein [Enterococcus]|uniref:Lipoprotein n=1 Tax=Enterococcus faecium TaxID=1352 RepID=A0A242BI24_ENTFC|nr:MULTISPECIES: hypothetical protein [Enterococcus]EME7220590.1 hypothetical protein [Enterococcus faecium]EME8112240.1 hypothetical protein [Enterococcus faecium]EME8124490.1 hypothetical protein [Enterococcus faecium]OTN94820.1 hypothetical protein A5810_001065 [Enterococcus faecium]OTO28641.1 hypothetical protein A5816_000909 [Enterococcus sp. 3G1_DIV0629]
MNKGLYIGLLGVALLFSACGNATKNSLNESSLINSTTEVGSTNTSNVDSQYSQSSIQSSPISSTSEMQERTEPSLPLENSDEALLFLIAHRSELQSEDIVTSFYQKIDKDYLFTTSSKQTRAQGGSGSVGFYRVSPDGVISITDAYGTPL